MDKQGYESHLHMTESFATKTLQLNASHARTK